MERKQEEMSMENPEEYDNEDLYSVISENQIQDENNEAAFVENIQQEQDVCEEREEHSEEETVITKRKQHASTLLLHETKQSIQIKVTEETVVRSLNERMREIEAQSEIFRQNINHQTKLNEVYQTKLTADEKQMSHLTKQLMNTKEIIDTMKEVVKNLEERNNSIKTKEVITQQLNEDCTKFLAMKKKYTDMIELRRENIKSMKEKSAQYEEKGENEYKFANKALKDNINKFKAELDFSKETYSKATQKYELVTSSLERAQKEKEEKIAKAEFLLNEIKQQKEEVDKAHKHVLENISAQKNNLLESLEKSQMNHQKAKQDLDQAEILTSEKENRLSQLQNECKSLKKTYEDLMERVRNKNKEYESQITEKKQVLEERAKLLSEVEQELKTEREQGAEIRKNTKICTNKLLELVKCKMDLMSKMVELKDSIKEAEKDKLIEEHTKTLNMGKLQRCKLAYEEAVIILKAKKSEIEVDRKTIESELESKRNECLQFQKDKQTLLEEKEKKYNYLNASYQYMAEKKNDIEIQLKDHISQLDLKKEELSGTKRIVEEKENKLSQLKEAYRDITDQESAAGTSQVTTEQSETIQAQTFNQETVLEKPVSILKSPKKPTILSKKVSFKGLPSFESSDQSEDTGRPLTTMDDIIKELFSGENKVKTSKSRKREFSE